MSPTTFNTNVKRNQQGPTKKKKKKKRRPKFALCKFQRDNNKQTENERRTKINLDTIVHCISFFLLRFFFLS